VLVIGNLYDPATRFEGAVTVAGMLPNSALLTVDVPGHTSLGASACAGELTGSYLIDPSLAPTIDGQVCPQEFDPFEVVIEPAAATALQRDVRHQLLPILAATPGR
jgi:TAP-like protein